MGRIALRDYLNQIVDLIDESRLDEAVAHCRNILEQHPRHLETYQLLGRALLELQNHDDATDIFQRVLSADPDSIISHAGLAVAHSESDDLPRAIWHMERAFDIDPYNLAILVELSELYARRDGEAPDQIGVTRAALARLYLRGSLFPLAAEEFSALLSENPDRIDLQLLLAETLYLDQKPKNAARLALKIVDKLPLCLKANAILAAVWFTSGRPDQAQQHLMRVRSLTLPQMADLGKDTLVAQVLSQVDQKQLPRQILVEEIDFVPVAGAGYDDEENWSSGPESESADIKEMPDWLREFSQSLDANRNKETGSFESPSNLDPQDSFRGEPTDDPMDSDGGVNSFGPKNTLSADGSTLTWSIIGESWTAPPHVESNETRLQPMPELPGPAEPLGEHQQPKTTMEATLVTVPGRVQGVYQDALVQEEEYPPVLQEEAMILDFPIDEDDAMLSGDNMAYPEDFEDEILSESISSEWPDETTEDPSEAIDPPDWLYDAVGLSGQSIKYASDDEEKNADDITRERGIAAELSSDADLPDWLSDSVDIDDKQPIVDKETDLLEDTIISKSSTGSTLESEDDSTSERVRKDYYIKKEISDQQGGANKSTEDAMNDALNEPGYGQDDERDDLDGELKWLEELAASQTASDDAFLGTGSNLDSLGALPDEDFIPDWLKADILDEAETREPVSAYVPEGARAEVPDLGQEGKTVPSQDVPDWLSEQLVDETLSQEEDDSADIDWFNQMIAGDESAIDELLEIQGSNQLAESDNPITETIEDQPSWLLELEKLDAANEDIPIIDSVQEEAVPSSSVESETLEWQPIESMDVVDEVDLLTAEDVPSDPEEAMAWLEQLALEQGLTGEDLTDEVSGLVPDEFMEATLELERVGATVQGEDLAKDVPDDPDEAMDWLERLAAEQGASEDELMTIVIDDDTEMIDEPASGEDDEKLDSALSGLADVEMPADQGEALFWLEELAMGAAVEPESDDMPAEEFAISMEETVIAIEPEDARIDEEIAIDSEAAQIAALMSEAADVLEEEIEVGDELELIDESGSDVLIVSDIDDEELDDLLAVETMEVEPEVEAVEEDDDEEDDDEEDDDLAWLDSLDEANVTGWLRAEEVFLAEEQAPPDDLTQSHSDIVPDTENVANDESVISDQIFEGQPFDDHGIPDLSAAQSALQSGQLTEALNAYSALVDSGESLPYVIADLEGAVDSYPEQAGFMKLLGDAYSRNGQLQKAIEIYRLALNNL